MEKTDKILIASVLDKYQKFKSTGESTHTNFMNAQKLKIVTNHLKHLHIPFNTYDEYPFLDKNIIYFGDYDDFITIYKVMIPEGITHSHILGTLFSLGLDSDTIGDIIVEDGYFYYTNLTRMNQILENDFKSINGIPIKLEIVDKIIINREHIESFKVLVSSMRIDNVLSKITNKSRSQVKEMLKEDMVLLNYEEIRNDSINLKEGDILSIRKFGKFKIGAPLGYTKKDNIVLEIVKFI